MSRPTEDELEAMAQYWGAQAQKAASQDAMLCACRGRGTPVAWRWRWNGGDEPDVWTYTECKIFGNEYQTVEPLFAAIEPAPDHETWDAAIQSAMDACTNVIKSYDVMDATGTKYLPMKTQKAAKGMVSIAREDIGKLKKGQTND